MIFDGPNPTGAKSDDLIIANVNDNPDTWTPYDFTEPLEGDLTKGELVILRPEGSSGTVLSGLWRSGKGIAGSEPDGTLVTPYTGTLGDETILLVRVEGTQVLRPSPAEVDDWRWQPWADVVTSIRGGLQVSQWCREQVGELAPLGPPSAWPTASSDLLPAALRPPHIGGRSNVGQTLIGEAS